MIVKTNLNAQTEPQFGNQLVAESAFLIRESALEMERAG